MPLLKFTKKPKTDEEEIKKNSSDVVLQPEPSKKTPKK